MIFRLHIAMGVAAFLIAADSCTAQSSVQTPFDAPQAARLASPRVTIPLTREGDFYYAQVLVNGKPFKFTLETGANFIGLSAKAAQSLGLKVDSVQLASVAGGTPPRMAVAAVDSLSIGGATYTGLVVRVSTMWDESGFDGIITLPFLRGLLATLDLPHSALVLERGSLPPVNGRDILPVAGADRGERVDVAMSFGDVTLPVVLDTRSFIAIALPDSVESRLRFESQPVSIGQAAGPALGSFQMRAAPLAGNATIAGAVFQNPPITLRSRGGPVIGIPILEHLIVTIDQVNKRVRITQADDKPIESRRAAATPPSSGQQTMGFNMAGFPGSNQLRLLNIVPGSDAERVGLKNDDILVEFDGVAATDMNPGVFRAAIARGTPVKVVVTRDGKRLEFMVKPYSAR